MKRIFTIFLALLAVISISAAVIDVKVTDMNVSTSGTNLMLTGTSDRGLVTIQLFNGATKGYGEYTKTDGYWDVYGEIGIVSAEGSGVWSESGLIATLVACSDGNTYNLDMSKEEITSQVLNLTDMVVSEVNDGLCTYEFTARNNKYTVVLALATATDYNGTFTLTDLNADMSGILLSNGNVVGLTSASINIATANETTIIITAQLVGSDGVTYDVTMTGSVPPIQLISTSLRIIEDADQLNLIASGYCELGNITLYLYDGVEKGYGDYGNVVDDSVSTEAFNAIFGLVGSISMEGTGKYEYSNEYNSDMITAILKGNDGKNYSLTMYATAKDTIEVVCKDLVAETISNRWATYFSLTGTASIGKVELYIYNCNGEYGEYGWLDGENASISGEINGVWVQGAGTWLHSEELYSDVLEAVLETEDYQSVYKVMMYSATTTAIEELLIINAPTKVVKDGQLIIIKNGVKFNAQGAIMR